jgi:hypothetical protein
MSDIEFLTNELAETGQQAIDHCKKYIKVLDGLVDEMIRLQNENQEAISNEAEKTDRHLTIDDFIQLGVFKGYGKAIVDISEIIHTLMVQNKLRKEK